MTLRAYYRRAAEAKADVDRVHARLDALGHILWKGYRPAPVTLKRWGGAFRRATAIARKRYFIFEVVRREAADRMLFDPYEEKEKREIAQQFVEARRRTVS